ncbi:MAG: helix-turn-helix transcriptional regulator [Candidatus Poribacteria bacterium]|nr:helix-turn-helix transcriptional regulator [Candidatus Poribacteria bacterium]
MKTTRNVTCPDNSRKRIAAQIRASGGTQEEAAAKSGYSREWVSRLETGGDTVYWNYYHDAAETIHRDIYVEAWHALRRALNSPDERTVLTAAKQIIERVERVSSSSAYSARDDSRTR